MDMARSTAILSEFGFNLFTTFFPTISMEIIHLVSAESVVLEVTYDCIQCRRSRGS